MPDGRNGLAGLQQVRLVMGRNCGGPLKTALRRRMLSTAARESRMRQDDEHVYDDYQGGTSALTQARAGTRAAGGPVAVQGLGGDLRIARYGPRFGASGCC